ncbi:MAG: aspartate carbamoyltransferase catalytic subunit [Rickettsiales bacterium]|jgi:aspartate carbamoyltransferase catalytic subunit|nr:aspartate carbamoyltransferase catalytic subunit [Rickettsiales bacterium]
MTRNLLSIDHYGIDQYQQIFDKTGIFLQNPLSKRLVGRKLINLFFEASTRTRSSFEIAAKNMGAEVINIDVSTSAVKKGESEIDTIKTLSAMQADFITIRHSVGGFVKKLATYTEAHVINSGDGAREHPTQALLDCFTILQNKGRVQGLNIGICGDLINSRVARSNIKLLSKMGANLYLIAPHSLMPSKIPIPNLKFCYSLKDIVGKLDVLMTLRIQKERMSNSVIASEKEYGYFFGLNDRNLVDRKSNLIILHPGPINRGVEISSKVADSASSMILKQVANGIAIRQAVLEFLDNGPVPN